MFSFRPFFRQSGVLAALVFGTGLGVVSCVDPPNYPETPSIEFKSITSTRFNSSRGVKDTISITVTFKDGDGDLGLDEADTENPPYDYRDGQNRFFNNFFLQAFVKDADGVFRPVSFNYDSRYPRLAPSDKKAPLRGELTYGKSFFLGQPFYSGNEVRFEISLVDRALNESNKVTTESIIIP